MQWSAHIPTELHVFRRTLDPTRVQRDVAYRAITYYGRPSQAVQLPGCHPITWSEPHPKVVWAAPLSLAATYGIDQIFLFLWVLRCFHSPGVPPSAKGGGDGR